jgi:hypothetical protein
MNNPERYKVKAQRWREENPERYRQLQLRSRERVEARASEIVAAFEVEHCLGQKIKLSRQVLREAGEDWVTLSACRLYAVDELLSTYSGI